MTPETLETLKSVLPVVVALLTLLGGGLVYNWQKSIDRKNQILQERRKLYRELMGSVQTLLLDRTMNDSDGSVVNFTKFKLIVAEMLVSAPDEVVSPLKNLDEALRGIMRVAFTENDGSPYGQDDRASAEKDFADAYEKTILEMRKDSFDQTTVSSAFMKGLVAAMTSSTFGIIR